jgi:hypothetical protein
MVPFHPYFTVKDGFAIILFLILFSLFVFFMPDSLGHADNYIPANPLQTPAHIVPEWYMLPFYAILRAIPDKFGGVVAMFGSIGVLFILPWLDTSKVRSMRYRPTMRTFFVVFVPGRSRSSAGAAVSCPTPTVIPNIQDLRPDRRRPELLPVADAPADGLLLRLLLHHPAAGGPAETPLPIPATISEPVLSGGSTP